MFLAGIIQIPAVEAIISMDLLVYLHLQVPHDAAKLARHQ